MYEKLKSFTKKVIPQTILDQNESLIRKAVSVKYMGSKHQCIICDFQMKEFITLQNADLLCPRCGSLSRNRRLWELLKDELDDKKVLHFSPSKALRKKLENHPNVTYITTDFVGEFKAVKHLDITNIDEPENSYDIVICYHVLEHIKEDVKAMSELFRILKPDGKCFIQTPFKEGDTYENDAIITDEGRLAHFGQEDHLRIYSTSSLIKQLQSVGFEMTHLSFNDSLSNWNGFKEHEDILIANKV